MNHSPHHHMSCLVNLKAKAEYVSMVDLIVDSDSVNSCSLNDVYLLTNIQGPFFFFQSPISHHYCHTRGRSKVCTIVDHASSPLQHLSLPSSRSYIALSCNINLATSLDFPAKCELRRPAVVFAGEHTHSSFYSTVHGAYLTGRTAATLLLAPDTEPHEMVIECDQTNDLSSWIQGISLDHRAKKEIDKRQVKSCQSGFTNEEPRVIHY
ncbi:hypothetical protein J6590_055839 [Homalodisca vitripennis]|nr:hypothetical protein J6590_055839 [Homalodisca vitripennis]